MTVIRMLSAVTFTLLLFAQCQEASNSANVDSIVTTFQTEFPKFMNGVGPSYGRDGYFEGNGFLQWSPKGFPLVCSVDGAGHMIPTVVAVPHASGSRIVAFGNPSYVGSACCGGPPDSVKRLVMNAVKWLAKAGGTTTGVKYMAIVVEDPARIGIDYGLEWVCKAIAREDPGFLFNVTFIAQTDLVRPEVTRIFSFIYITSHVDYTDAQAKALVDIIAKAQPPIGLLVSGRYFETHGENPIVDLRINRILWPLGLAYTMAVGYGMEPRPNNTPNDWIFYNTLYLAARLQEAKTSGGESRQIDPAAYPEANVGIKLLIDTLSARAKNGSSVASSKQFSDVWKALEAARPNNFSGVGPFTGGMFLDALQSPPAHILDAAMDAAYIRSADISKLKRSLSAAAYPGLPVPPNTALEVINVTIQGSFPGHPDGWDPVLYSRIPPYFPRGVWRSTGVYAPAGVRVTSQIIFPGAAVGGLKLQIGSNPDDTNDYATWSRVPCSTSVFDLRFSKMDVGSPLGGPIYIFVPDGSAYGKVQFTFTNVIRAPYFQYGKTEVGIWSRSVRSFPAPRAELVGHKVNLMVPSQSIRDMADPRPIINYWDQVVDAMDWLSNINRTREERLTNDVTIGSGWVRNGYPIMLSSSDNDLLSAQPGWSTLNIVARNFLTAPMAAYGYSMSNLFVAYVKEWVEGIPVEYQRPETSAASREAARKQYIQSGWWYDHWKEWIALDMYLQLAEGFGWDFYRRLFAAYQVERSSNPSWWNMVGMNEQHQTWIVLTSRVAGRNLIPFYQAWKFPLESYTRSRVLAMKLPLWEANPMIA